MEALPFVLDTFAQPFRELANELASRHPDAHFSVRDVPFGTRTAAQGHMLFVECYWPGRRSNGPDNVILEIELYHLTTVPQINADVCWGSGQVEVEFVAGWSSSNDWPEVTPEILEQLIARMPEFFEAFREAAARGNPGG
jgi:hypothetical protein